MSDSRDPCIEANFSITRRLINDVLRKILPQTGGTGPMRFGDDDSYLKLDAKCEISRVNITEITTKGLVIEMNVNPSVDVELRFDGTLHRATPRVVIENIDIAGELGAEGGVISLAFSVANLTQVIDVPDFDLPRLTRNIFDEMWNLVMRGADWFQPVLNKTLADNPYTFDVQSDAGVPVEFPELSCGENAIVGKVTLGVGAVG